MTIDSELDLAVDSAINYLEQGGQDGYADAIAVKLNTQAERIHELEEIIELVYVDMKNRGYCDQDTFRMVIKCREECRDE